MSYWQTTWNPKVYDYKRLIEDYRAGRILEIKNSKGMAKMKKVPQIDDIVYVSCDKKNILRCVVMSEFEETENGGYDEYSIGPRKSINHSQNNLCLRLKIVEAYDDPILMLGYQRTWVKLR